TSRATSPNGNLEIANRIVDRTEGQVRHGTWNATAGLLPFGPDPLANGPTAWDPALGAIDVADSSTKTVPRRLAGACANKVSVISFGFHQGNREFGRMLDGGLKSLEAPRA